MSRLLSIVGFVLLALSAQTEMAGAQSIQAVSPDVERPRLPGETPAALVANTPITNSLTINTPGTNKTVAPAPNGPAPNGPAPNGPAANGPAANGPAANGTAPNGLCSAPRDLIVFNVGLPGLLRAVAKGGDIDIVALGSSSTAGSGASSPQAAYPARLDAELDRRFPGKDFRVDNQGAGGMTARDMLARIHKYVSGLERAPALVIWQTGVNDAVQDVGLADFSAVLDRGILDLRSAGIDVILVDMQYFPRSNRVAVYGDYLKAMRQVAEARKVPLFQRYAIMKHLVKSGQHTSEELLAPDNFHLNDLSYGCLADLLADAIEDQIKTGRLAVNQPLPR